MKTQAMNQQMSYFQNSLNQIQNIINPKNKMKTFQEEAETESVCESMAKDYLEDPAGFINELEGELSESELAKGLDDNYPGIELARGLIQLFKETVELTKKVKAADQQFDTMRKMIYDFQTK
jgi:hypothetical protein